MPRPISELSPDESSQIRLVASDIDDTMTVEGQFTTGTLELLKRLDGQGISTVLVTGRPAGLALGLVTYLPFIDAVIAENGGVLVTREGIRILPAGDDSVGQLQNRLRSCHEEIALSHPDAQLTPDRFARLTDLTFAVDSLWPDTRGAIGRIAKSHGFTTVASSIHLHVKLAGHDKGRSLASWMVEQVPVLEPTQVMTIGDSLNDAPLFDVESFPVSVGVANLSKVLNKLPFQPAFLTQGEEGAGFAEAIEALLAQH